MRPFVLGNYPETFPIMQGNFQVAPVAQGQQQQLAVLGTPIAYSIDVQEIVRCTCLANASTSGVDGPGLCAGQPDERPDHGAGPAAGGANHWSECWIDLQLGLAYLCGGKDLQAKASLERAVLAAGQFDHPLTGIALPELGRLVLAAGDYSTAANYFAEASYTAGGVHGSDRYRRVDPLRTVDAFAFQSTGRVSAPGAGDAVVQGEQPAAVERHGANPGGRKLLRPQPADAGGQPGDDGHGLDGTAGDGLGKIGAKVNLVAAQAAYLQNHADVGDKMLAAALNFQKNGSVRLFHIALADTLYKASTVTPRVAMELYNEVLRDPLPIDWATDPLESLSLMVVPHQESYENWLEVAIDRKDHERVLEISDLVRGINSCRRSTWGAGCTTCAAAGRARRKSRSGRKARATGFAVRYPDYVELRLRITKTA